MSRNQEGRESKGVKESTRGVLLITAAQMVQQMRWEGMDGWMRSESETGSEGRGGGWHESTCLTVYIRSRRVGELARETLLIFIVLWPVGNFSSHRPFVSKKNGRGAECEILIPSQRK